MSQPWLSLENLPHFFSRRPAPDCLLVAGPRRKAARELINHVRQEGFVEAYFCGYLHWWMFRGEPREIDRLKTAVAASLKPWRLPDDWMTCAAQDACAGHPTHTFRTNPDGYRAWMPRDRELIDAVEAMQSEIGDDAHLEWGAAGFEWVLRRKSLHRRLRAFFLASGFRPKSPVLDSLVELRARSHPA